MLILEKYGARHAVTLLSVDACQQFADVVRELTDAHHEVMAHFDHTDEETNLLKQLTRIVITRIARNFFVIEIHDDKYDSEYPAASALIETGANGTPRMVTNAFPADQYQYADEFEPRYILDTDLARTLEGTFHINNENEFKLVNDALMQCNESGLYVDDNFAVQCTGGEINIYYHDGNSIYFTYTYGSVC